MLLDQTRYAYIAKMEDVLLANPGLFTRAPPFCKSATGPWGSNSSDGNGNQAAVTPASSPTARRSRRMGSRFVEGLNPRSMSMLPRTEGHSASF
jgi:hypothetical protein